MPANFTVGARYSHQSAPGVANYLAANSASGLVLTVSAGIFANCVRVTVTSGTNGIPREFTWAPGIGLVCDGNALKMTSFVDPNIASGAPVLAIQQGIVLTWPLADGSFRLESSSDLQNWLLLSNLPYPVDGRNQVAVPRGNARNYFRLVKTE